MALIDWFKSFVNKDTGLVPLDACIGEIASEVFYKQLAVEASINLIANTVARSEFLTYERGKEVKGKNYYLLNVRPNQNKSSSKFWREVVSKLVYDNECLIIMQGEQLYVADSFAKVELAFKENIYKDIVISNYELDDVFKESQVLYLEWHDKKIKNVIDSLYADYGKLINISSEGYKGSKSKKGILEIPTSYPQTERAQEGLKDLLDNRFKKFFEAEGNSLLPLQGGLKYQELEGKKSTSRDSETGREIRDFINDIFDFVAIGFQIPPSLLKGDVVDTNNAMNNFLTFCINPIAELITDEVNGKMYNYTNFIDRTYAKLDTSKIKVVDLKDIANALDVLTRIGAYSVDDSLKALGMEPLDKNWSKARWMTKNYEAIEDRLGGGG